MGNCCNKDKEPARNLTLAILGLDNAGKTVTAKGLLGEPLDTVTPTIGFTTMDFKHGKHKVVIFDLGGGKKIRDIWHNYFAEIYGLIFVVDASDVERIDECKKVVHNLIEHPQISGKPVLLLANKQDVRGAMDDLDVVQAIGLEDLVNLNKCPCRVETCSATVRKGKKIDPSISDSFSWLINNILNNYDTLNDRVSKEMEEKEKREKIEKEARLERVKKIREERERLAGKMEEPPIDDIDHGDPFKRVNISELEAKEKLSKEEKRKKSHNIQHSEDSPYRSSRYKSPGPIDHYDQDNDYRTHTSRSLDTGSSTMDKILHREGRGHDHSTLTSMSMQQARELDRRKFTRKSLMNDEAESGTESLDERRMGATSRLGRESADDMMSPQPLPWNRPLRSMDTSALALSPRNDPLISNQRRGLMPLSHLQPLNAETLDRKKKKKKHKGARFNQTEPATDEDIGTEESGLGHKNKYQSNGYSPPPQHRTINKPHNPRLEPLNEPTDSESLSKKWGLGDIDDLDEVPEGRRSRPNTEYDSDIMM